MWILVKMVCYCVSGFWIVGADQGSLQLLVFYLLAFAAYSYGNFIILDLTICNTDCNLKTNDGTNRK